MIDRWDELNIKVREGDTTHSYREEDLPLEFLPYMDFLKFDLSNANPHISRAYHIRSGLDINAYYKDTLKWYRR